MKKRIFLLVLLIAVLFSMTGCQSAPAQPTQPTQPAESSQPEAPAPTATTADENLTTREIVDLGGRTVTIPKNPQRIAVMTGPSYEMVFMLGGKDRIVMTKTGHTTNYPLALLTNPDLAHYEGIGANPSSSVNIEEYLKRDIDLVVYYFNDNELEKFAAANIPAVVLTLNTSLFSSLDDVKKQTLEQYIENSSGAVRILADILGEEAIQEYEDWKAYNEEKIRMLDERTRDLTDDQRRTVYWGNTWGENILSSYTVMTRYFEIRLTGGSLVGPELGGNFPEVTAEQLFAWDPDVILVDNHGNYPELVIKDMLKDGSRWASLQAVKNKQLYRIPAGVFFLDKGTTTTLMLVWLATVIQPELFADINIIEEIQYYYREFYEFDLSEEHAQRVLDGWYERLGDEPDL
jgi:iron complex transport system substrate-binding protein